MASSLYFDHDSPDHRVVLALRSLGGDLLTSHEAGNTELSDAQQLEYAAVEGRIIFTANVSDFGRIHTDWMRDERSHGGKWFESRKTSPWANRFESCGTSAKR